MTLNAGDLLANKYRIEAEIGRGAFGRVYRARDITLDRVVAIKELHKGEDDLGSTVFSDYVRRFEREARVQARFNHPNIVHVYELVRLGDDRLYLAMEFVDSESLRDYLARRGPLSVDEALRIMADLLAGLAAVHADERDIVHRDIKPSNVMLTRAGQAKLTDFGLAQVGDESLRSGAGQPHPGSPMYMSPEQETTNAYLYPASDVFSAGCVLFELLTGVVYKQAKRRKQGLCDLRPDAPDWLAEVVARALVREADDRPADAGDFAVLLREGMTKAEAEERAKIEASLKARLVGLEARWHSGARHPKNPKITSTRWKGKWRCLPGYCFGKDTNEVVEDSGNLSVEWNPGLLHPDDPRLLASDAEGTWLLAPGYTWKHLGTNWMIKWDPGQHHRKTPNIVAGEHESTWLPEKGFAWTTPDENTDHEVTRIRVGEVTAPAPKLDLFWVERGFLNAVLEAVYDQAITNELAQKSAQKIQTLRKFSGLREVAAGLRKISTEHPFLIPVYDKLEQSFD